MRDVDCFHPGDFFLAESVAVLVKTGHVSAEYVIREVLLVDGDVPRREGLVVADAAGDQDFLLVVYCEVGAVILSGVVILNVSEGSFLNFTIFSIYLPLYCRVPHSACATLISE